MKKLFLLMVLVFSCVSSNAQNEILIERLQQGGLNIFIRHAITPGKDPVKFNPPTERPNDCSSASRQRNDEGRAQSRRIGQRIKELNIPIGEVYSSGFCRCEETAKLVVPEKFIFTPALNALRRAWPICRQKTLAIDGQCDPYRWPVAGAKKGRCPF